MWRNIEKYLYFLPCRVPKWGIATGNHKKHITGNFSDNGRCTVQQSVTLRETDMGLTTGWQQRL